MPGYLKVDGAQHPVVAPYVKVNGSWTPSALGYIKVEGVWKIWHSAKIEDTFNRVGAGDLGTSSNGFSKWTRLSGNWGISNNQASHDSAALGIVATQLYKATTDYKVSADISDNTGLGVGFWIQDADNWHAAIPGSRQQNNPSYYSCPSGFTLEGTNCRKTTVYSASYEADYTVDPAPYDVYGCSEYGGYACGGSCCRQTSDAATATSSNSRYCPNGGSLSGTVCTVTSSPSSSGGGTVSLGCLPSGECGGAGGSCGGSCKGGCLCSKSSPVVCKCGGSTVSCSSTCTSTYISSIRTTTTYSCSYGTLSGDRCYYDIELGPPTYERTVDPAPYVVSGRGYYCPSGGTNPGGSQTCTLVQNQNATFNPATTTYPSVIRIYKSLSGTITQEFIQDIPSDPRSFEVSTSGSNIQVYLYSAANLGGTRIAAVTHATVNAIKTTTVGLAKYTNQVQRQGTVIDNFKAE